MTSSKISRRGVLALLPLALAACTSTRTQQIVAEPTGPLYNPLYGYLPDERFPLQALDLRGVDPRFLRQIVPYQTSERVGTIVVSIAERHLYLVQEGGMAMRYGVGVGRAGYDYQGNAVIGRKAPWPRWTPTPTMIREDPERNGPWANGMEPGLQNPLGARALYLYNNGRDTLYRIHGTNEPWSIGQSVSSGCVRLFNHDIIDLYDRVAVGSRVVVQSAPMPSIIAAI